MTSASPPSTTAEQLIAPATTLTTTGTARAVSAEEDVGLMTAAQSMPRTSTASSAADQHNTPPDVRVAMDPTVAPLSPASVAYSHATHLSARRTFAGGIVRYYTTPDTLVVPDSSPIKVSSRSSVSYVAARLRLLSQRQWWAERLELALFTDVAIWKAAAIEMLGTTLLTFMVLVCVTSILNHKQDYSYFPTAIAICHIPIIAFLIFATATATGGRQHAHIASALCCRIACCVVLIMLIMHMLSTHMAALMCAPFTRADLNPMISFSTWLAGLTEFPRMVLYMIAQLVGAILGSYIVKHLTPSSLLPINQLGMCSLGVDQSVSQALTLEIFGDLFVLYVAFGVALDDRQRQAMPSWLPPFVISTTIALLIYTTSTISGMGTGSIAFPTRCFGPAVAMGLVTADSFMLGDVRVRNAQWIYWSAWSHE